MRTSLVDGLKPDPAHQREAVEPALREALERIIAGLRLTGPTRDENCSRSVLANELAALLTDAPARQRDGSPRQRDGSPWGEMGEGEKALLCNEVEHLLTKFQDEDISIFRCRDAIVDLTRGNKRVDLFCDAEVLLREYALARDETLDAEALGLKRLLLEALRVGHERAIAHPDTSAAPPPYSAPASGETRVTEEIGRLLKLADEIAWEAERTIRDDEPRRLRTILNNLRHHFIKPARRLASIQPTPATGVDRAGVLEAAIAAVEALNIRHDTRASYFGEGYYSAKEDAIVAIRALQPAAAKPQSEWRPISEAPKDGTPFAAFQDGDVFRCHWREAEGDEDGHSTREGWFDHVNQSVEEPTHWQHLPAKPQSEGER